MASKNQERRKMVFWKSKKTDEFRGHISNRENDDDDDDDGKSVDDFPKGAPVRKKAFEREVEPMKGRGPKREVEER